MFYLTTQSTHIRLYGVGHMVMTTQIAREETRCHHTNYSFRLAGRVLLYAPSNRQNNTNQGLCNIICATPVGHNIHKHNRHFVELYYFKFKFQPEHHNWCNKSRGMYYPACGIVHIKNPLLLVGKNSPCSGGCGFPLNNPSTIHFKITFIPYIRIEIMLLKTPKNRIV